TSRLGFLSSSPPFSTRRPRSGRHSPALTFRRKYIPKTKRTITPMTAPAIAHGCHHGWRTLIGIEALFSVVTHVYGSDLSKTYACRVLFPCPYSRTVNTSCTVASACIARSTSSVCAYVSHHSATLA